jgi:lipopolysaccharide export system permease protein
MIRTLPTYILREHVGPFVFGVVVITFVLIMDMVIDYIDLFLGKGVALPVVLEVFLLSLGWMMALSIPMAVLVASLMTFGRMAQDHEITAMKASGLSFGQILLPVMLAGFLLAGGLLLYNDRVLPESNHRLATLFLDIHRKKPAIAIREGRFVNIQDNTIHVRKLDEKTSHMEDITINRTKDGKEFETIHARLGRMEISPDGNTLTLFLEDGEIHSIDERDRSRYNRLQFESHEIHIRDIGSELKRSEGKHKGDREMSIAEMRARVRTVERDLSDTRETVARAVHESAARLVAIGGAEPAAARASSSATPATAAPADTALAIRAVARTEREPRMGGGDVRRELSSLTAQLDRWRRQKETKERETARFEVEIQKKMAIPFACVVFVLIGAPLGIRVGRGGVGASAGLSLGFFLVYYLFLVGGEELADRGIVPPVLAMWAANALLCACGAWLFLGLARSGTGRRRS